MRSWANTSYTSSSKTVMWSHASTKECMDFHKQVSWQTNFLRNNRNHMATPNVNTPRLWCHWSHPPMFSLVVDDFRIQYTTIQDAQHLLAALKQHYEAITVDWTRSLFCSISLKWDDNHYIVDLSMPGYINSALEEFEHPEPNKAEHQPHQHNPSQFGTKMQPTTPAQNSQPLDKKGILQLQETTGNSYIIRELSIPPWM
jgi:hypothetical protein